MPNDEQDLTRRLQASIGHRVPDDVRARHLNAIGAAVSADAVVVAPVRRRFAGVRRGVAALAASVTVMVPTGVAVASQGALPGGALYDVKRATETVLQVVDPAIRARHRIDELERLLDAGAPLHQLEVAVARALDAVQALPADDPLQLRLLGLLHRYDEQTVTAGDRSGPSSDDGDDERSGSGSDDDGDDDRSGSDDGSEDDSETETESETGSETETDDDSSGPGSGDGDDDDDDSSGPGSGDDDDDLDDSSGEGSGSDD